MGHPRVANAVKKRRSVLDPLGIPGTKNCVLVQGFEGASECERWSVLVLMDVRSHAKCSSVIVNYVLITERVASRHQR